MDRAPCAIATILSIILTGIVAAEPYDFGLDRIVIAKTDVGGRRVVMMDDRRWFYDDDPNSCFPIDVGLDACPNSGVFSESSSADPDSDALVFRTLGVATEVWNVTTCNLDKAKLLGQVQRDRNWDTATKIAGLPTGFDTAALEDTWSVQDGPRTRLVTLIDLGGSTIVISSLPGKAAPPQSLMDAHKTILASLDWFPGLYHKAFDGVCGNG